MPFENRILMTLAVAALAAALGLIDNASAASKKKLTYEQAYAKCKSVMDKEGAAGVGIAANLRYTKGAGCMKKYGYQL